MIAAELRPGMRIMWRGNDVTVVHVQRPVHAGLQAAHQLFVTVEYEDGNTRTAHFYDNDVVRRASGTP